MSLEQGEERKEVASRLLKEVGQLLIHLTEREARILKLRYGIETGETHTLQVIGKIFHVTRERIRIIEERALYKLAGRL